MKKAFLASAAIASVVLTAIPVFAQGGPFADVPADHWAYTSVEKLQKAGIVIGYPDNTYQGKRGLTRYEFAIAIARLLDKIPQPVDISGLASKSDLAGLASKDEVAELRKLVDEFKTELTTLGVDLDNVKKKIDDLEKRVAWIEEELKRVKISGDIDFMVRGNHRTKTTLNGAGGGQFSLGSVQDHDGFPVTVPGKSGSILSDTRALHDFDLNIKARLSETAVAEATLNFGNYLPYLNGVASFSGARSGMVNQNQDMTVYKLVVSTPLKIFGALNTNISVGRLPLQLTPYTFKLIDVDTYFYDTKTDGGDIPVDGAKVDFLAGPVSVALFGAKTDPIKYVSNASGTITGDALSGIYAGAGQAPFAGFAGTVARGVNRPGGSPVAPGVNGAMAVEQLVGGRATFALGKAGTVGGTVIWMGGKGAVTTAQIAAGLQNNQLPSTAADRALFNEVLLFGGDFNGEFSNIGIKASYTVTNTYGPKITNVSNGVATVDNDSNNKIDEDNAALDLAASFSFGDLDVEGGYRDIGPFFAAPGSWGRLGSYVNPVDIKGPYVNLSYALDKKTKFVAGGHFYEGTGDAENAGGLNSEDKITNYKFGIQYGLTSASGIDLGMEFTEYKVVDNTSGQRVKPQEIFYNIGYGLNINKATSFKLLYQIIDYKDKNSGFDTFNGKGGVAAAQFNVKF